MYSSQPVRFVTVAPIPDAEVPLPPTTPGIDLPVAKTKTIHEEEEQTSESAVDTSLVSPPESDIMEQFVAQLEKQRISDKITFLIEEKESMRSSLTINTSCDEWTSASAPVSPTPSPASFEIPERPSAPAPLSPCTDDDDDFPLGILPSELHSRLAPSRSFGESSVTGSVTSDWDQPQYERSISEHVVSNNASSSSLPQTAASSVVSLTELVVLKKPDLKNVSSTSLPQTPASPVPSLSKKFKFRLPSPKSRSTSDLSFGGFTDGVPLARGKNNYSGLKRALPVLMKIFEKGNKGVTSFESEGLDKEDDTAISIAKVKGQKRQRDDDEADENAPPVEEKNKRQVINGRHTRRKLAA